MHGKLIIEGNAVYELDEACLYKKNKEKRQTKPENKEDMYKEQKKGGR